jgi:hypothetical protein
MLLLLTQIFQHYILSHYHRLRRLITKYKADLLPNLVSTTLEETVLQTHLKAALEALWSTSEGSWEKLMKTLDEELGKQVSQ